MKQSIFFFFKKSYGVSNFLAFKMCGFINVSPKKNANEVSDFKRKQAFLIMKDIPSENTALKKLSFYNTINHLKGFKLRSRLPINGQRNKTNAKTARKNAVVLLRSLNTK